MPDLAPIAAPEQLMSEFRHGRAVLMLIDNSEGGATGVVTVAGELCEPAHITFMARQARGLVCLGLTQERCEHLQLPLMVEGDVESAAFTLSIEAAVGIDTGISAADRALTVRTAVASDAVAADLVQPGHIFPVAAAVGGVLTRTDRAEATTDLAGLAGLLPAAVFTDVLDRDGNLCQGDSLLEFARKHGLAVGRVSDLVHYRLANQRTIERIREGQIDTAHGPFQLTVYQESNRATLHFALSRGTPSATKPTLVRVHVTSLWRDLVGTRLADQVSWRFDKSLAMIAEADDGVLVLLTRAETAEELLAGVDRLLGNPVNTGDTAQAHATVGLGAQILNDLGVGKIRLMGAHLKYNALAGFGLEVVDFVDPE